MRRVGISPRLLRCVREPKWWQVPPKRLRGRLRELQTWFSLCAGGGTHLNESIEVVQVQRNSVACSYELELQGHQEHVELEDASLNFSDFTRCSDASCGLSKKAFYSAFEGAFRFTVRFRSAYLSLSGPGPKAQFRYVAVAMPTKTVAPELHATTSCGLLETLRRGAELGRRSLEAKNGRQELQGELRLNVSENESIRATKLVKRESSFQ